MSSTSHPDHYLTVEGHAQGVYKELRSKFLSFIYPISSAEEAEAIVATLKDRYFDARHHCWAYRLGAEGDRWRANDDGEPSSTAGKPILGQLLSANISDALIVVVRYFGGTKLGVPGLIRAYREAAKDAVANSVIVEKIITSSIEFTFSYTDIDLVMRTIKLYQTTIEEQLFESECKIKVSVRDGEREQLIERLIQIESVQIST